MNAEQSSFRVVAGESRVNGQADRHSAFLRAFTAHNLAISSFIRRLVPSRSDADDLMQEVAVVLWEKFDEFEPGTDFRAWTFRIARFKILSRLRNISRERLVLANDVVELLAAEATQEDEDLNLLRDALEGCFAKLRAQDRDLLLAAYEPGGRIQDIAQLSGRSVTGFYQWVRRMRQRLLECLERAQTGKDAVS